MLIRAALTEGEWSKIQALAAAQGLHASQLVARTLRATLLGKTQKGRA